MDATKISATDLNLSLVAGNIVSNAVEATRHLFCPFCADSHLFEFTLKEHLKQRHADQLQKHYKNTTIFCDTFTPDKTELRFIRDNLNDVCKFCGAIFLYADLLPKHIANYHGQMCLKLWQEQQQINEPVTSVDSMKLTTKIDPTILYALCSPGLSEIFDKISTRDTNSNSDVHTDKTPLKSILKKSITKSANRIICSPSSTSIRRTKNTTLVRRSSSVRRELRFDFVNENQSPENEEIISIKSQPRNNNSNGNRCKGTKSKRSGGCVKNFLLGRCITTRNKSPRRFITSTPINFLDNSDSMHLMVGNDAKQNKSWRGTIQRQRNKPLFALLERFQCAHCKRAWDNNADLLTHLDEKHKNIRKWFQADYRCGTCSATFYSNRFLVRHCHVHHTPVKRGNI